MPKLGAKILGVLVLSGVGVFLSYFVFEFVSVTFPEYAYKPYHDRQPNPDVASTPTTQSVLPPGPVVPTPAADLPPATPVRPSVPSTPTPSSVQESAPGVAGAPTTHSVAPSRPVALTPPADLPPATPVRPSVPPTPTPLSVQESAPPAVSLGGLVFHVQAGAFKQRESADTVIRQLRANGYTVTLKEGALLRVWVGPAMDRTAGERLAAKLRSNGFDAFLSPVRK